VKGQIEWARERTDFETFFALSTGSFFSPQFKWSDQLGTQAGGWTSFRPVGRKTLLDR
jgi:hypothetical protein